MNLMQQINALAGPQRHMSFQIAAEFILRHKCLSIVETGCYRGIPADGQSTVIFALLNRQISGTFTAYDISQDSIDRTVRLLTSFGLLGYARLVKQDSVIGLAQHPEPVNFAYLDSYDFDEKNPLPCQRHQLAEVGAVLGKVTHPGAIMFDDCGSLAQGGKAGMSAPFLRERGWKLVFDGYQQIYTNE